VRFGDLKLIVTGEAAKRKIELFDLKQDPNETTDLAASQPEKVKELQALLTRVARADRDAVVPKE
jgi:arylsulfatase A-like enzyme